MEVSVDVNFVEAFTEASVGVASVEVFVEAFTEASVEETSVEASTTKFRGSYSHESFHASIKASNASMEAFMSFYQK